MDPSDFGGGWDMVTMRLHWVIKKSMKIFVLQEIFYYWGFEYYNMVMAKMLPPLLAAEVSNREDQKYNRDSRRTWICSWAHRLYGQGLKPWAVLLLFREPVCFQISFLWRVLIWTCHGYHQDAEVCTGAVDHRGDTADRVYLRLALSHIMPNSCSTAVSLNARTIWFVSSPPHPSPRKIMAGNLSQRYLCI